MSTEDLEREMYEFFLGRIAEDPRPCVAILRALGFKVVAPADAADAVDRGELRD